MKAYCINLDRRPDRLAYISGEFARLAIPFERVAAVDAQDPSVAAEAARIPPMTFGPRVQMSAGAYGCFQSHREIWRRLLASGDSHAMAFEDDLVLAPGLAGLTGADWIPADADIVKIETFGIRVHLARRGEVAVAGGRRLAPLRSFHHGTGSFVISAAAAARLLALTETISLPIDRFLFDPASPGCRSLRIYQMSPAPVVQGDRAAKAGAAGGGGQEGWAETSITERYHSPDAAAGPGAEGTARRLRRRLREEIRARLGGTRYVTVPFG